MGQHDNAGHDEAPRGLTEASVAAMIGEDWSVNVADAEGDTHLAIDWSNKSIYSQDRFYMGKMVTQREWNGHVSIYDLPSGCNVTCEYLLRHIAAEAEEIADVAEGYESVWDGRNHVAEFEGGPGKLLADMSEPRGRGDGVYERWDADEWLSEPFRNISDVYQHYRLDISIGLEALIEGIIDDAKGEHVALDYGDLERHLTKLDKTEVED